MLQFSCNKTTCLAVAALMLIIILAVYQINGNSFGGSLRQRTDISIKRVSTFYTNETNAVLGLFESIPNNHIWKPHNVSEQTPFIFMHQRKAGGTSLRSTLHTATRDSNMSSFLPCFGGVDCRIFTLPTAPRYAVYGIHTTWNDLERLISENEQSATHDLEDDFLIMEGTGSNDDENTPSPAANSIVMENATSDIPNEEPPFSCLTNFREPVSRLVSCLYFRFDRYFLSRNLSCINDLSVARMTKLLVEKVDAYSNSCLNEPFRVLGPIDDEHTVTSLGYDYNSATYEVSARRSELELATLNATLHNLQSCVPIVLEIPQSRRLLKVAFPSLYAMNAFDHGVRIQEGFNYSANCSAPTEAHMHVLRQLTSLESVLYRAVVKKVHSALAEFNISRSTTP